MLRDRGTIKWTSLMLPEHVQILKDMWEEDKLKTPPQLDEQALQQLNDICLHAFENQQTVRIIQFKDGDFIDLEGVIERLIPEERSMKLKTSFNTIKMIPIKSVIHMEEASE